MRPKTSVTAIVVAVFIVAAMAPSAPAAPPDDACLLVTQAQVISALGVSMGAGSHVTPTFLRTCTWAPAGGPTQGVKAVTLMLQSADGYEGAKQVMGSTNSMKLEPVSGIGDDAYYSYPNAGNIVSLIVKKGNTAFKVAMYGGDFPIEKKKAIDKTLALQVLSKL